MPKKSGATTSVFRRRLFAAITAVCVVLVATVSAFFLYRDSSGGGGWSQRVSAAAPLRMEFPVAMNREELQDHLIIPADLTGQLSWEDNTLIFDPASPLAEGERVTFHVDQKAPRADGTILGRDLDFTFEIAGPPTVTAHMPAAGAANIAKEGAITIIFDRPMVALTQVQGSAAQAQTSVPVTVSPSAQGSWRWLSSYALQFTPDHGFTLGQTYTVSVPAGMKTAAGETIEKQVTWSFETLRPSVIATDPVQGYAYAGPTSTVELTFNQEMDLSSAREHLFLLKGTAPAVRPDPSVPGMQPDGSTAPTSVPFEGTVSPVKEIRYGTMTRDGKQFTDRTKLVVVPATPLSFDSRYGIRVSKGIRGIEGELGSAEDFVLSFQTVGTFKVSGAMEYGGVRLTFSNPLKPETKLMDYLTIEPPVEGWGEMQAYLNQWLDNREASLYPSFAPSTTYKLTVKQTLADSFGQTMKEPYTFTFTTPAIPPEVSIRSRGDFGVFEKGKAPVFYVNSVNVSSLNARFTPLDIREFLKLRQDKQFGNGALPAFGARSLTWDFPRSTKLNERQVLALDMDKQTGGLRPGLYALAVQAPEFRDPTTKQPYTAEQYFAVTNIGLTLKYSGNRVLVWAADLQTGGPVAGADMTIYNLNGDAVLQGKTDAQGFYDAPIDIKKLSTRAYEWRPEFWVKAEKAGDIAYVSSQWTSGIDPGDFGYWTDFQSADAPAYRMAGYLYTERPIYAAGDTVHFKGIVRYRDWKGNTTLPVQRQAIVTIMDSRGTEVFKKTLPVSDLGAFNDSFTVDAKAALGDYNLTAQMTPGEATADRQLYTSFSVLAYRKPEFRVDVTPATENLFNGQSVKMDIAGAYYFGAPMAGAPVEWRAMSTDYFFNRYTDGWYSFALEDQWCWEQCDRKTTNLTQGKGVLDAAGRLPVSFPITIDDKGVSQVVTVEADVTDPNNQLVSNRASAYVHKADAYVGVRSLQYVVAPGDTAAFDVITLKPDGSPLPEQRVVLSLYSRTWNSIRKKGVDGEYYYDNTPQDVFIRSVDVRTGKDGKGAGNFRIDKGGSFRVVATAKDAGGRETKAGTDIYAWSSTYVNWPHANNDRIAIELDKPQYKVGDVAKLLVKSPYQGPGVKALVTVERENVMTRRVIDVVSNAQPVDVPITADLVPNAFVSVTILKPRIGETFDDDNLDTGAPAFKMGYAKLNVETSTKELTVTITTDKQEYLPGEKVTATVQTTNAAGNGVSADVSLGAVDMSLLALSGFETPNLVKAFYAEQGLGVFTSQMLTQLLERFKPGSKGGGGGDLESRKRGNFKDTAYWNPSIRTDGSGKATVSFTLPDNLTTWKLLSVAHSASHLFGAGTKDIVSNKRVVLRTVRPRFAVRGDAMNVSAIVLNQTTAQATYAVSLGGSGFTLNGEKSKSLTLKPGEQGKVSFPIRIGSGASIALRWAADSPQGRDAVDEKLPVYIFGTPQSVTTTGVIDGEGLVEKVRAPSVADAPTGSLLVTVSPTLATYLAPGLQYLEAYPYGCAEQTVSGFLPAIALKRLRGFEAFRTGTDADLDARVNGGVQRLYTFQRPDGGFGFWEASLESNPQLSAYVLYGLQMAKANGYAVDENVLARARTFLQQHLRNQKSETRDLAERAFILYVLAEGGQPDVAQLNALYDKRKNLPVFAKSYLVMALQKAAGSSSPKRAADVLGEILDAAKVDPRGTHFEEAKPDDYLFLMNTNDRTTALVLQALLRVQPDHPVAPLVVRYLLAVRRDGHWDTTQSTTHAILALTDYLRNTEELTGSFTTTVKAGTTTLIDKKTFGPSNILTRAEAEIGLNGLKRDAETDIAISKNGTGRLYYDLLMSYAYTPSAIEPAEQGMSIVRSYAPALGKGNVESFKVGETYRVTLTLSVPEDRHYVAVDSPLPAGMEPIDLRFQTSQQQLLDDQKESMPWNDPTGAWRFSHRELRDDSVFLFAEQLPAGVYTVDYLVRATVPGTFRDRPAHAWEMYFPETFGQTGGDWFTIRE